MASRPMGRGYVLSSVHQDCLYTPACLGRAATRVASLHSRHLVCLYLTTLELVVWLGPVSGGVALSQPQASLNQAPDYGNLYGAAIGSLKNAESAASSSTGSAPTGGDPQVRAATRETARVAPAFHSATRASGTRSRVRLSSRDVPSSGVWPVRCGFTPSEERPTAQKTGCELYSDVARQVLHRQSAGVCWLSGISGWRVQVQTFDGGIWLGCVLWWFGWL